MMISPIQFQILLVTLLKDRSLLIDNYITSKSIHQSTFCHHCPDWWKKLLKKIERIIHQFLISCMLTMLLLKILLPWRPLLVKKLLLKKIILTCNSWKDSRKSSSHKDSTSQEDFMIHLTWPGNCFQFIHKKACLKFPLISLKNIIKRDLMKTKKMKKKNDLPNDCSKFILYLIPFYWL